MFPKRYADAVARLRVPFGFVLVVAFAWLSRPSAISLAAGFPVAVLGLALRAWAAGHLEKNSQLAVSGPYRFVRNPLYLGTLLVAAGLAVASRRWLLGAVFGVVFLCVYLPVIQLEEQHLRGLFPEYEDYAKRVPALVPWGAGEGDSTRRFRWALYVRNREYEALVGLLVGAAFLVGKFFW
jgi:protein-S-isoprenylcysteine O-methyltransferase Ste14